jgi:outer membrane protein insertion porin family
MILALVANTQISESNIVSKIYLQGNKTFRSKSLKKMLLLKGKELFDEFYLEKDVNTLTLFYQNQGFNKVNITTEVNTNPKGKNVYYRITENPRTRISQIKASGIESFAETKIISLLKIKKGDYLITSKIEEAEQTIINWYKNSGFPYIDIERKITIDDNNQANIDFHISEGPLTYIKEIKIRGNQKVSNAVILRTSEIKIGEKFSLQRLESARQRLYSKKLFERVSFYILDSLKSDSVVIRFDVLEVPSRSIGFGLGVQTPPTRLILSSEWEHSNFLSRGHNLLFSLGYAPTFTQDWRGEIKSIYRIYYILNTPINFLIQPSYKYELKDEIKRSDLNVDAGLSRYFGLKFEIGTFLRYLRVWTNQTLDITSSQNSITNSQNLYLRYDTRDNFFAPTRGIYFSTNLQYAGSIYDGDNNFYKTQTEISLFGKIFPVIVFGGRLMTGLAIPYGRTSHIPYFEAFTLGGNNGLRGYDEKALGPDSIGQERYGEAICNINLELRTHLEKLFDFVVFSDIGKVTERKMFTDLNFNTYQYSVGTGIRVNTPFGPIRLDYAKRLKDPPEGDWGKIHLAILNAF